MNDPPERPRISDIAKDLGLHKSTVSLALNSHPKISARTTERVKQKALEMGYFPDPVARTLSRMRRFETKGKERLPIAWLNLHENQHYWTSFPAPQQYLTGAKDRAYELGYYLENFWLHAKGMKLQRIQSILYSRAIDRIIMPLYFQANENINHQLWDKFSVVSLCHAPKQQFFDHVCPDYYHNMGIILDHLVDLGYRKIGLALKENYVRTTRGLALSRYLTYQQTIHPDLRVPPCLLPPSPAEKVKSYRHWITKFRPDIIISRDYPVIDLIREAGFMVPDDIEVVHTQITPENKDFAGILEHPKRIGAVAVDWLVQKTEKQNKADSVNPLTISVKGDWQNGFTLSQ